MISLQQLIQLNRRIGILMQHTHGVKNLDEALQMLQAINNDNTSLVLYVASPQDDQPFKDCNRRTAYEAVRYIVGQTGKDIKATKEELHALVESWSTLSIEEFNSWIELHTRDKTGLYGPLPTFDEFLLSLDGEVDDMAAME